MGRAAARRHRLTPYFRPLRRGPGSVQLGGSAEGGGFVLDGLADAELAVLDTLAAGQWVSDAALVAAYHAAPARAVAPAATARSSVSGLVSALASAGALVTAAGAAGAADDVGQDGSAEDVRALGGDDLVDDLDVLGLVGPRPARRVLTRAGRTVLVTGQGRLTAGVVRLLRATGVGRVGSGSWAQDHAEADGDVAAAPYPDVVVAVADRWLDPREGERWVRRGVPLLPVVTDGRRVVLGPVVALDPAGPCLWCMERSRADLDPARPMVLADAAVSAAAAGGAWPGLGGTESTLVAAGAGLATMMVHAVLAGDPVPTGVALELELPWPAPVQRRWRRHLGCTHHPAEPPRVRREARVTMTG